MVEVFPVTLPELTGGEERRAYVYLPRQALEQPERRFPVLYMFDGHNVFFDSHATYGKSWGMSEYLDKTATPLIVAAVECNRHPDHGRLSEYAPFSFRDRRFGAVVGRGRATMDWFVHSFKPFVDGHFPTLPDREHCFIAGSSMGGLMSLYALACWGDVFSRAAALSPALAFARAELDSLLREADFRPDAVLYMDYGEREFAWHGAAGRWRQVNALLQRRSIRLTSRIVPGGEHCEASWEEQLPFFIPALLYGLED